MLNLEIQRNPQHFESISVHVLTFDRVKEVEERVVGHLFGNSADSATAFMLLLLLNGFHCHILPLVPVYLTARERRCTKKVRGGRKQGRKNGKSWKTCQVEADMWDVKSREINIERVNRIVLKDTQSLYFYFKISCVNAIV